MPKADWACIVEERARLVLATLLKKKQIDSWFTRQRQRRPEEVEAAGYLPGMPLPGFHPSEQGSVQYWKEIEQERQAREEEALQQEDVYEADNGEQNGVQAY